MDTVGVEIKGGTYGFRASGSVLKFAGFLEVYQEGQDDETLEEEGMLPELTEGERVLLQALTPKQHFTQPPQRYTEASLVKALEEKGIGRPSTYAPTITTILSRGYVEKEKKILYPTELGKIVTDIMKNYFKDIVDIQFTAQLEDKLDSVEEGNRSWVDVLREFYKPFAVVLSEAESQIGNIEIPDEVTDVICEKCGRNMVIKQGRFGKFLACPGFPECRNARPIIEEAGVNCPKCGSRVLVKKTRKGKKYFGCEKNPECDFMTWDKPSDQVCEKCGSFMTEKNSGKKKLLKCANESCGFVKEI
jgi:Topoisomerase IA